jgi:hypothetical protein
MAVKLVSRPQFELVCLHQNQEHRGNPMPFFFPTTSRSSPAPPESARDRAGYPEGAQVVLLDMNEKAAPRRRRKFAAGGRRTASLSM